MKKMRLLITVLALTITASMANAVDTIGVANYKKIEAEYNYAKQVYKQIDDKILELQQFVIDKDKQFKAIESPIQKKNFEEKTQKEFAAKRDALEKLQIQKEEDIYNRVMTAARTVANERKIEAVFDKNAVFVGGADITDEVIRRLNAQAGAR